MGVYIFPPGPHAGDSYEGEERNDTWGGYGVFTWPTGERYEGHWRNGKRDGYGVWTKADGTFKSGLWRNDAPVKAASDGH